MSINLLTKEQISSHLSLRNNETKLGEKVIYNNSLNDLKNHSNSFVIVGIEESIGPRANLGKSGAENAWKAFISSFLNTQYNHFIESKNIIVLGNFKFDFPETNDEEQLRLQVSEIDNEVSRVIETIIKSGNIPIVIGGGHNNAYPLLKGTSQVLGKSLSCLNIDPHADFRALEGRHSGNGFSYAHNDGLLNKYAVFGLHENYNSHYLLDTLLKNNFTFSTFDEMLFANSHSKELTRLLNYLDIDIALEIDMDCMAHMPSSAYSPSGFTLEQVRSFIYQILNIKKVLYLHLPEGAPKNNQEEIIVGKALTYLVTDFIKNYRF